MATYSNTFEQSAGNKKWGTILTGIGILTLLAGIGLLGFSGDEHSKTRFWAGLLQNSVYFLLVVNAAMFFLCATTLGFAGFTISFRRVAEAISTLVPIFGVLAVIVLLAIVFTDQTHIYHWMDTATRENDKIILGKSGFLSKPFFVIWTIVSVAGWTIFGAKMRKIGREADETAMDTETAKKWLFKNSIHASLFIVCFGLTVASTIPWFWLMSIDAHWYSTMYSWYVFASTFVAGLALIALYIIYLKNQGHLPFTTKEHLHDIGKFMFAFSIFWTYLWFSQFMLIWYANIPEETEYFRIRMHGEYRGLFWLNLILNFVTPFLLLMKANAKRNYTIVTFAAVVIIFGHWLDFYLMVAPSTMKAHGSIGWFEIGVAIGYVGLIILLVGRGLSKSPLVPMHHPLLKESIIHHT